MKTKKLPKRNNKGNKVVSQAKDWDDRPSMSFTEKELPSVKGLSLKEKITVEVELELVGTRIEEYGDKKGQSTYNFKVCSVNSDNEESEKK